jgi:phosphoribosylformylglycinamidine synthase
VLKSGNKIVGDLPVGPLVDDAPIYDRPYERRNRPMPIPAAELIAPDVAPMEALRTLMATPDLCAKRWIWEQYDHMVMADTIVRPGGDAGVVRVHGSNKGLAISTDCTPRYCAAHPETGGAQAVAETWRNLTAVGATPLAITDCLNFGNPERPEVMGQFVGCIEGMAEACRALDYPVISGNVSFYNETEGLGILPTPAIGGVGLIADIDCMARIAFADADEHILLIGETKGHLDASIYAREMLGREDGPPPPVDLAVERRNGDFVRQLIEARRIRTCHDISDGGLLVAVAEMSLAALAEGRELGAKIDIPKSECPLHAWLFGEDQARYIISAGAAQAKTIIDDATKANIPIYSIGLSGGATLTLGGTDAISLDELQRAHEDWLPHYMEAGDGRMSSGE